MRISVFGLGYVGAVTGACWCADGHDVIGVDVSQQKVDLINAGQPPIVEPGLSDLYRQSALRATTQTVDAVKDSTVSMISVGTPQSPAGDADLSQVKHVCEQIGRAVADKKQPHVIVLRSTVPPGTLRLAEQWMRQAGGDELDVHFAFNPEFLREGNALSDYDSPPFTIIGTESEFAESAVREMYAKLEAPVFVVEPETAEMVKYVCNAWHAAKITFANEVGRLAKHFGVSGRAVMEIVTSDTKLNVSPAYMKPGFAYGGSCLPKDVSALLHYAKQSNTPVPLLEAIPQTNQVQIDLAVEKVLQHPARDIAVFGLAFKAGTDDLRLSPAVALIKQLIGEGRRIRIYDQYVHQSRLMGANLAYIRRDLPHFEAMLYATPQEALEEADLVVKTYHDPVFTQTLADWPRDVPVIDVNSILSEPEMEVTPEMMEVIEDYRLCGPRPHSSTTSPISVEQSQVVSQECEDIRFVLPRLCHRFRCQSERSWFVIWSVRRRDDLVDITGTKFSQHRIGQQASPLGVFRGAIVSNGWATNSDFRAKDAAAS